MHFEISFSVIGEFNILLSSCNSFLINISSSFSFYDSTLLEFSSLKKSTKLSSEGVLGCSRLLKLFKYFQYSFGDFLFIFLNFVC